MLVVEDESDLRSMLLMTFGFEGWDVAGVADGGAALEWIAEHGVPDVVVTDRQMPGMDGGTLIRRLRDDPATAGLPILLLSGIPDEDLAATVMLKPFDVTEVIAKVSRLAAARSVE